MSISHSTIGPGTRIPPHGDVIQYVLPTIEEYMRGHGQGILRVVRSEGGDIIAQFMESGKPQGPELRIPETAVRQAIDETAKLLEPFRDPPQS